MNLSHEDLCEAWEHTKASGGKYLGELTRTSTGYVKVRLRWMPFRKRRIWADAVNEWRDEMEIRYGSED